jgi:hypothetical protein
MVATFVTQQNGHLKYHCNHFHKILIWINSEQAGQQLNTDPDNKSFSDHKTQNNLRGNPTPTSHQLKQHTNIGSMLL